MTANHNDDNAPEGFQPILGQTGSDLFNGPFLIRQDAQGPAFGFRCKTRHLNAAGQCHDTTLAAFANMMGEKIGPGNSAGNSGAITLSIDFITAVNDGDWIEASPEITHETRSMTFFQALATANGKCVLRCNGILRKQKPSIYNDTAKGNGK